MILKSIAGARSALTVPISATAIISSHVLLFEQLANDFGGPVDQRNSINKIRVQMTHWVQKRSV